MYTKSILDAIMNFQSNEYVLKGDTFEKDIISFDEWLEDLPQYYTRDPRARMFVRDAMGLRVPLRSLTAISDGLNFLYGEDPLRDEHGKIIFADLRVSIFNRKRERKAVIYFYFYK